MLSWLRRLLKFVPLDLSKIVIHSFLLSYEKLDKVEISNYLQNDYYIGLLIPHWKIVTFLCSPER